MPSKKIKKSLPIKEYEITDLISDISFFYKNLLLLYSTISFSFRKSKFKFLIQTLNVIILIGIFTYLLPNTINNLLPVLSNITQTINGVYTLLEGFSVLFLANALLNHFSNKSYNIIFLYRTDWPVTLLIMLLLLLILLGYQYLTHKNNLLGEKNQR